MENTLGKYLHSERTKRNMSLEIWEGEPIKPSGISNLKIQIPVNKSHIGDKIRNNFNNKKLLSSRLIL